uniref:Uncharacterized protein n=1 Tax=Kalanchoe fedtschenkoi TaxID=63787 RepID=A0A7N0U2P3_KALFE
MKIISSRVFFRSRLCRRRRRRRSFAREVLAQHLILRRLVHALLGVFYLSGFFADTHQPSSLRADGDLCGRDGEQHEQQRELSGLLPHAPDEDVVEEVRI